MADAGQKRETGRLLFVLGGIAAIVFSLAIVVIWALSYGPLG
ncbi:hypothetical protein [Halobaculum sp. CBA1158]|nr:hypothetical protein [Halobaculum sp. CBA1158]